MKKRGTNKGTTIDINEVFLRYVTPEEDGRLKSYKDVADEMGIHERTIEKWGAKYSWVKKREQYGKNRVAQWLENQEETAKKINEDLYKSWRKMLTLLEYELDDIDLAQMFSADSQGVRTGTKRLGARAIKDLSDALTNTTNKLRILTGQTSEYTKSDVDATITKDVDSEDLVQIDEYLKKLNHARNPQDNVQDGTTKD